MRVGSSAASALARRAALWLLVWGVARPAPAAAHAARPSVVVFGDDVGWRDAVVCGTPEVRTLNIDRLARSGLRVERAFLAIAQCSPSRIEVLATTDAAADPPVHHQAIRGSRCDGRVVRTFRPDAVFRIAAPAWLESPGALERAHGGTIADYAGFVAALAASCAVFQTLGATATDHAVIEPYTGRLTVEATARPAGRVEGIHAFAHPYGCSRLGDDLTHTQRELAGLLRRPEAGGVIVPALGCENNQMQPLLDMAGGVDHERLRFFNTRDVADEIEQGVEPSGELVALMASDVREPCPASELVLGHMCGGSDGSSGISANALAARIANRVSALGAVVLLTEVPDMFGAELVLMARADVLLWGADLGRVPGVAGTAGEQLGRVVRDGVPAALEAQLAEAAG